MVSCRRGRLSSGVASIAKPAKLDVLRRLLVAAELERKPATTSGRGFLVGGSATRGILLSGHSMECPKVRNRKVDPAERLNAVYDTANCIGDLPAGTIGSLGMIKPAIDIRPSCETRAATMSILVVSCRAEQSGVSGARSLVETEVITDGTWRICCCQGFDGSPVAHYCVLARDGAHAHKSKSEFPRTVRIPCLSDARF